MQRTTCRVVLENGRKYPCRRAAKESRLKHPPRSKRQQSHWSRLNIHLVVRPNCSISRDYSPVRIGISSTKQIVEMPIPRTINSVTCSASGRTPCTWGYTLHCGVPPCCTAMRFTPSCTTAYPLLHGGVPFYPCTPALRRTPLLHCDAINPLLHCGVPPCCTAMRLIPSCTVAYPLLHCGVPFHPCTPSALRWTPLLHCDAINPLLHCGLPPSGTAMRFFLPKCRGYAPMYFYLFFGVFVCPSAGGTPQCIFYSFIN